jgi:3-dehydroquinate dehydratase-2
MKILIINGPNLNLLGKRDSEQYGNRTLQQINSAIKKNFPDDKFKFYQSNVEGELVNEIQSATGKFDGLVINPGGFAHTSVVLRDALEVIEIPKIEVHLSNLAARESFRNIMLTASVCDGYISGFKEDSYIAAVFLLKRILNQRG